MVRSFVTTLNYQADESLATIKYYLLVSRKVRDDFNLSYRWVCEDKFLHVYSGDGKSDLDLHTRFCKDSKLSCYAKTPHSGRPCKFSHPKIVGITVQTLFSEEDIK